MKRLWKYGVVAVLAFVIGSATVVSAQTVQQFVISNGDGTREVEVSPNGRLNTNVSGVVSVRNFPDVQQVSVLNSLAPPEPTSVVNIIANELDAPSIVPLQGTPPCLPESTFVVPSGKTLLLTDIVTRGGIDVALGTDARGIILQLTATGVGASPIEMNLDSPLKVNPNETVCPFRLTGNTNSAEPWYFLATGRLVDAS